VTVRGRLLPLLLAVVIVFFASVPALAAVTNEDCFGCHDTLKGVSHGGIGCVDCHSSIKELPHAEKLPKPACAECHDRVNDLYNADIHKTKGLDCGSCHNAHYVQKEKKGCVTCHRSVSHAMLPEKQRHLRDLSCTACHGKPDSARIKVRVSFRGGRAPSPSSVDKDGNGIVDEREWRQLQTAFQETSKGKGTIEKSFVISGGLHTVTAKRVDCARCHSAGGSFREATLTVADSKSYELKIDPRVFVRAFPSEQDFGRTVHGKAGVTCTDCHGPATESAKPAQGAWAIDSKVCAKCHQEVEQVYGLSQHAKMDVAKCVDCHNPHSLRPYRELRAQERIAVCARCHSDYLKRHSWLPNTALHFGYLECATCHSPKSQKSMVYFFAKKSSDKKTPLTYGQLSAVSGKDPLAFVEAQKAGPNGYDTGIGDLFTALRGEDKSTIIDASIIVTKVYHDYSETRLKEKECITCHSREAGFYDSMLFQIPGRENIRYVPMKGTLFSSYPIGTAVDFFLLGEDKLTRKDFATFLGLKRGSQPPAPLGFKLIDIFGLVVMLVALAAICVHVILRIFLVKR
jgi:predicted CXXCH cytochrome family protein